MNQIDIDRYNKGQNKALRNSIGCGESLIVIDGNIVNTYGFLIDPKYGWREMFDKDPDYQKEFKEWYQVKYKHRFLDLLRLYRNFYCTPKDLLTGGIIEFMQERVTNQQTKE